jgi:hypothetical protein
VLDRTHVPSSSLLVCCHPAGVAGAEPGASLVADPLHDWVQDLGFSDGDGPTISHRPPRPATLPYDAWCSDRFFRVRQADGARALGTVEVDEAHVYDNRYRGDIDFTGLQLTITLGARAPQAYRRYFGTVACDRFHDADGRRLWTGTFVLRIPARPFDFPTPRGSADPWTTGTRAVGRLRSVARFDIDRMDVFRLHDAGGFAVPFDALASGGWERLPPALHLAAR